MRWCVAVQGAAAVRAHRHGGAVGVEGELPAPSVDGNEVVEGTEKAAVGEGGGAVVGASLQVVDVAGDGGLVAAGEATMLVAAGDGSADLGRDVGSSADIQRQANGGRRAGQLP